MTPAEAAALLEIAPDSTPDQIEGRFFDLRTKLEEKIGKAPTPGLKDKYRRSLEDITTAFETLTLAADSSTLPVLKRATPPTGSLGASAPTSVSGNAAQSTGQDHPVSAHSTPSSVPGKKNSNKEFILVAIIAVILLGGGGWFVVKTRAEADQVKAEAARKTEESRLAAEKQNHEKETALAGLRAQLAEARVTWETFPAEVQSCDRRLSELKSDARNTDKLSTLQRTELAAQQAYSDWLTPFVQHHPVKRLLAKLEALTSSHDLVEARLVAKELSAQLAAADRDLSVQKKLVPLAPFAIARENDKRSFEEMKVIRDQLLALKAAGQPTVTIPFIANDERVLSMNQEISKQEIQLNELLKRYTEKHPNVIGARHLIEQARIEFRKATAEAEAKIESDYRTAEVNFENSTKRYETKKAELTSQGTPSPGLRL